jgi:thioredoxin-related protein
MKNKGRILYTGVMIVVYLSLCGVISSKPAIQWMEYNTGLQKAKTLKRPIFIDFYAEWCHWCRVMDRQTFSDEMVIRKVSEDYVAIRIDVESGGMITYGGKRLRPKEFAAMIGVEGLPTLVFMDRNGEMVTKIPGYIEPGIFLSMLGYIKEECYKRQITFKDYINGKDNCRGK